MKKMNLKKMLTMAIATIMAISTMSISAMAEDSMEGMVTIFNYNAETKTLDVSYIEESSMPMITLSRSAAPFTFSQNIGSTYNYLVNTSHSNPNYGSRLFNIVDNNAIEITLTSYDRNSSYYFEMYEGLDFTYIPVINGATPILTTPTCYITGLTQGEFYSFQLRKSGSSYMTTGTLTAYDE